MAPPPVLIAEKRPLTGPDAEENAPAISPEIILANALTLPIPVLAAPANPLIAAVAVFAFSSAVVNPLIADFAAINPAAAPATLTSALRTFSQTVVMPPDFSMNSLTASAAPLTFSAKSSGHVAVNVSPANSLTLFIAFLTALIAGSIAPLIPRPRMSMFRPSVEKVPNAPSRR